MNLHFLSQWNWRSVFEAGWNWSLRSWRSCLICLNTAGQTEWLCNECWLKLAERKISVQSDYYAFSVRSIFTWLPEDSLATKVVQGLKAPASQSTYSEVAEFGLSAFADFKLTEHTVFIPAPPRVAENVDHAHRWAIACSQMFSRKPTLALKRTSGAEQKGLSLAERKKAKVRVNSQFADQSFRNVVFCDDIITSGSTALAAFEALGKPERFEVWTIAHRPKLRP